MKLGAKLDLNPSFVSKYNAKLGEFVSKVMDDVKLMAAEATPKKTGRARNGWKKVGDGPATEVVNQVPYIQRLNEGSSRLAPNGIVRVALAAVKRKYTRL